MAEFYCEQEALCCLRKEKIKAECALTDRELKKLNKSELLEILIEVSDENEVLRKKNAELQKKLDTLKNQQPPREALRQELPKQAIPKQEIGSIAEVAVRVNGVFEAAQAAADQYLAAIRAMYANKDEDYRRIIKEAMYQADEIVKEAERTKAKKIAEADAYCSDMMARFSSITKNFENYGVNYEYLSSRKREER